MRHVVWFKIPSKKSNHCPLEQEYGAGSRILAFVVFCCSVFPTQSSSSCTSNSFSNLGLGLELGFGIASELAKLEKQRGFSDHPVQESHRNSQSHPGPTSSSSSWSSGEFHHSHQSHYQDHNFNDSNQNLHSHSHSHSNYYHHHHSGHFNGGFGYGPAHHVPISGRKRG